MNRARVSEENIRLFRNNLESMRDVSDVVRRSASSTNAEQELKSKAKELETRKAELQSLSSKLNAKATLFRSKIEQLRVQLASTPSQIERTYPCTDSEGNTYYKTEKVSNPEYYSILNQIHGAEEILNQILNVLRTVDDANRRVSDTVVQLNDYAYKIQTYTSSIMDMCSRMIGRIDFAIPSLTRAMKAVKAYSNIQLKTTGYTTPSVPTYNPGVSSGSYYGAVGAASSSAQASYATDVQSDEDASPASAGLPAWWFPGACVVWLALRGCGYNPTEEEMAGFIESGKSRFNPAGLATSAESRKDVVNGYAGKRICTVGKPSVDAVAKAVSSGSRAIVSLGGELAFVSDINFDVSGNPMRFFVSVYDRGAHAGVVRTYDRGEFDSLLDPVDTDIIKKL